MLGILWNIQTDVLKLHSTKNVYPNTKHGILSLLCSLFSALGIVVTVGTKTYSTRFMASEHRF